MNGDELKTNSDSNRECETPTVHTSDAGLQASKTVRISYILKWYHRTEPRHSWFIRGIKPDGSFYGEVTAFRREGDVRVFATGSLSQTDYANFLVLIDGVEKHPVADDPDAFWDGLLAEGPIHNPRIIIRYREEAHRSTEAGRRFLELVDLMAPHLRQFEDPAE